MAKKRINNGALQLNNTNSKKINTELKENNYDLRKGRVAFENVSHSNCCISDWFGNELKQLVDCFKKIESLEWKDILGDEGLNFERNANIAIQLPKSLPKDVKLCSMRVNKKMRIYGYRAQEYFYIVWFDKGHEVCPMNKPKKYSA